MQKTTSLPEAPAVAATSAASTSSWLSGANPLFRLPGNAPFPQQPQTPTLCPSPWKILLPAAPQELPPLRRAAPQPSPLGLSPRLSCYRNIAEKIAESADAAVPLSPRSVRRGQSASPGKRGSLIPHAAKAAKKDGPRKKRRPSECSAAETANPCRKPTCWASACSDKFHALRTCSPDTCPWSCRARCGRRGSDAPADRRWKDQRTDLRFHPA